MVHVHAVVETLGARLPSFPSSSLVYTYIGITHSFIISYVVGVCGVGLCVVVSLCMVVGAAPICPLPASCFTVTMAAVHSLEYEHRKVLHMKAMATVLVSVL